MTQRGGATHRVRAATRADAVAVAAIYNHYIEHTVVTFEEAPLGETEMAARIAAVSATHAWYVAETDGAVAGYAYAHAWQERASYRHTIETSVYIAADRVGRGLGRALYAELLEDMRRRGFHCAISGVALPNPASVALHEKLGFVQVAEFKGVGYKLGRWVDVGYWQLMLGDSAATVR